jgi:hypothetical protein
MSRRFTHTHGRYSDLLRAERSGFGTRFLAGARNFSLFYRIQTGFATHPVSYAMGSGVSFPEVKRPVHEADHSPPSSAEIKNEWRYTSTPIRFHGEVLSWAQGQLYLLHTHIIIVRDGLAFGEYPVQNPSGSGFLAMFPVTRNVR